jgi:serpin B
MDRRLLAVLALVLIFGYFGVNYGKEYMVTRGYAKSDQIAQEVNPKIIASNTHFALELFSSLNQDSQGSNVFISPLSISTALTMAYSGADGTTEKAMRETLGYFDLTHDQIEEEYEKLLISLETVDSDVILSIANSVWVKEEFEPQVIEDYMDSLKEAYHGELFTRPFNQDTVNELNNWVSKNTEQKIDKILDKIDPQQVMFLVNAIYFKADWTHTFEEKNTQEREFLLDETTIMVNTMSQENDFKYYNGSNFVAARFPYGREQVAMYIFLTDPDYSIDQLIEGLTAESLERYIDEMYLERDLKVRLPKFKFEYGVKRLNDYLIQLGMGEAFDFNEANFTKIADVKPENLYIDFVDHKAVIEVDEKGTVAAAVTNVGFELTSARISKQFYVNRPFFFVIRDDRTASLLFMGKIVNPLIESGK